MSGRTSEQGSASSVTRSLYDQHLLRRLDHLLTVAAPSASTPRQQALVAHALRHVLADCGRADLAQEATARLRAMSRPTDGATTPR